MNAALLRKDPVPHFVFPALEATGLVRHAFSTRLGGVSPEPFDGLNLGLTTRDTLENVMENRRRFSEAVEIPLVDSIALVHGTQVHYATGALPQEGVPAADAIVTNVPGVPITLYYADCCPIFILDPVRPAIGLVHAGWRGSFHNAVGACLHRMGEWFGTRPQDCLAGIASAIGPCCFEVDWDVAGQLLSAYPQWEDLARKISNKWLVDLWEINARQLEATGVGRANISLSGLCTACRGDLFFSFRRDQRNTGRMASTFVLTSAADNRKPGEGKGP